MAETYKQESKNQSRALLIQHAVAALTTERHDSFLVTKEHFNKITNHFNSLMHRVIGPNFTNFHNTYNWQFLGSKDSWHQFYDSLCKPKTAAELKVLYLSGPEPLNDIEVLCNHGIRLENIWAIESEKDVYQSALDSLITANIHIKIHRGKLDEFFELVSHEFDIIYYDACTPIFSPNGSPTEVLKQLFINKRLTGLSALITNFAEPKNNYNWGDILGCWFSTKYMYEVPSVDEELGFEVFRKQENFSFYSNYINQHIDSYYDSFLTHFISTFAGEIIPMWQTVSIGSLQNRYLLKENELFKKLQEIRDVKVKVDDLENMINHIPHFALAIDAYPLLNWVNMVRDKFPKEHVLNRFLDDNRKKVSLENAIYVGSLLKRFEETTGGFKTFINDICNDNLTALLSNLDFFDRDLRITCDIPMKNLFVELLYGIYGFPYIAHAGKLLSLKYKAKETTMYSNVFVFDQCRYLYDYLPTLDLWESFFANFAHQTTIRGCIDGIRRNHLALNSSLYLWGFIEGIYGEFTSSEIKERLDLNS